MSSQTITALLIKREKELVPARVKVRVKVQMNYMLPTIQTHGKLLHVLPTVFC